MIIIYINDQSTYVLELLRIEDGAGHRTIEGQTWIQNMMYVASKTHPELNYGFKPHRYGMYSENLKNILIDLNGKGLIYLDQNNEKNQPIHLTAKGLKEAEKTCKHVTSHIQKTLLMIKSILNVLRYDELVVLMYTKYPEMLEKSEQKNKYNEWRENTAISMVQNDKVSSQLGLRMSGLSWEEFRIRLSTTNPYTLPNNVIYVDAGSRSVTKFQ